LNPWSTPTAGRTMPLDHPPWLAVAVELGYGQRTVSICAARMKDT
jgi:hypothetical protein